MGEDECRAYRAPGGFIGLLEFRAILPVVCPDEPPNEAHQSIPTRRTASAFTPIQPVGPQVRASATDRKNAPRHA
jgi:hypothetical protein